MNNLPPIPYPIEPAKRITETLLDVPDTVEYFGPLALDAWRKDYVAQWGEE